MTQNKTSPQAAKVVPVPVTAAIVAKAEKKTEPVVAVSSDPEDSFPTDWMNPKNVMKYDIDNDPMKQRIESSEEDTEAHRTYNLKNVDLVQSKKKVYQFLYVTDE